MSDSPAATFPAWSEEQYIAECESRIAVWLRTPRNSAPIASDSTCFLFQVYVLTHYVRQLTAALERAAK